LLNNLSLEVKKMETYRNHPTLSPREGPFEILE